MVMNSEVYKQDSGADLYREKFVYFLATNEPASFDDTFDAPLRAVVSCKDKKQVRIYKHWCY